MLVLLSINLTLITLWAIIVIVRKKKVSVDKIVYRQSHIHEIVRNLIPKGNFNKPKNKVSQSKRHIEKNMIRVIMIEEKAYWVANSIFYVSETVNGDPDLETAKPIDTENMSKDEIDKMLSILDSLRSGVSDEGSGAGNN
jgi:hypothetical protein